ncbi:MAG: TRAP transporter small permease [Balneolales bacterium]|nr:TRAP transporter small permease [Balneolales bacterium]
MNKLTKHIDNSLKVALAVLMALLVVNVCWQVFSRYVLLSPSSFTDELARYLLIWLSLIGAAYMVGQNEHLAINILSEKMNATTNILIKNGSVLFFALSVMVIGGILLVSTILELEQRSATLQIPMGYIYLALPISGVLICYYSLTNIFQFFNEKES